MEQLEPTPQLQPTQSQAIPPPNPDENTAVLEAIQGDLERILNKLNESDQVLNQLEQRLKAHEQRQNDYQQKINELKQEIEKTDDVAKNVAADRLELENKLKQVETEKAQLTEKLAAIEKELQEAQEEMKNGSKTKLDLVNMTKQNEILQQKVTELEAERDTLKKSIEDDASSSKTLQEQLETKDKEIKDLEDRLKKLNLSKMDAETNKEKNKKVIEKIKDQVLKVEQRIIAQTARIGEMGQFTVSESSSAQVGAGKGMRKPTVSRIKGLDYLSLFPILNKVNRSKLEQVARMMNMNPKKYPLKRDLITAVKLGLHCKAGIVKSSTQLRIVGKNMQIVEIVNMKTKNDICKKLSSKLSKVSLRKIQKVLL